VPHLRGLYSHWRKDAGWQTEEQFSDGTLRLLGLLVRETVQQILETSLVRDGRSTG
jgi:hypothetical protein